MLFDHVRFCGTGYHAHFCEELWVDEFDRSGYSINVSVLATMV